MYSNSREQVSLEEAYRRVHLEEKEEACDCKDDCDCETDCKWAKEGCDCGNCEACFKNSVEGVTKKKDVEKVKEESFLNESGMIHDYLMSLSDSSLDRLMFWVATVSGFAGASAVAALQELVSHFKDKNYMRKFLADHPKIQKDYQTLLKVEKEFEKYKNLELDERHIDLKKQKNALLHMIEMRLAGVVAKAGHGSDVGEFTDKLLEVIQKKLNEVK
jgi:hypothetical protein